MRLKQKLILLRILNTPELTEVDSELENSNYCKNKSFLKRQKLQIKGLNDGIWLKKDVLTQQSYVVVPETPKRISCQNFKLF